MEQIPSLKEMPLKKRIAYLWDYYSKPAIIIIIIAAFVIGLICNVISNRPPVMELLLVNTVSEPNDIVTDSMNDFLAANGYNPEKDEIFLNTSFHLRTSDDSSNQTQFLLQEMIEVKNYSGFFADPESYEYFAGNGYFQHLGEFLTNEELEKWQDHIIYGQDAYTGERYPCGLLLNKDNCPWLADAGYETCGFGFLYSKADPALCSAFLHYILE